MNRFLPRVLLGIFLLAALPLQTIAAMNSLACAGVHGDERGCAPAASFAARTQFPVVTATFSAIAPNT